MDKQLSVLKHLVYILTGSAVESMEEVYKDTIRHAEELGISVQISGNFPMHPSYRLLTDRAIRECVTNCARLCQTCPWQYCLGEDRQKCR